MRPFRPGGVWDNFIKQGRIAPAKGIYMMKITLSLAAIACCCLGLMSDRANAARQADVSGGRSGELQRL
jgi:hypothetical protein